MKISGSVALVTGANGGIGRALVAELQKRGAAKIYVGVRNLESAADLFKDNPKIVPLVLDLAESEQIASAAARAADVNLLINNAGFAQYTGVLSAKDTSGARREMDVNYFGPLALAQEFRSSPALHKGGAVVNILSFLALATIPSAGTYSASKSAALALTRTLRAELKQRGAQVLAALPVQVDTPMGAGMPDPKLTPEEVASSIFDALEAGKDEVFPGTLSEEAAARFAANPIAVQGHLASIVHNID